MPPSDPSPGDGSPSGGAGAVRISDVMGRDRSMNIFAGLVRDVESVSRRLDDPEKKSTVLAPLNSAMERLPQKPWEDQRQYGELGADAYEGEDGQKRAQRNLQKFVEEHIIPVWPWPEGRKIQPVGGDREVWWEEKDGVKIIYPGDIEVVSSPHPVSNGQVWMIKSARNYSS